MEPDEHLSLLDHMTDRQTRPVPITPGRTVNGSKHLARTNLAQVPKVVLQDPLLDRHLSIRVQMLDLAAATSTGMQPEVGARRLHPLRALPHKRHQLALLPLVLAAMHLHGHPLERQGPFNEDHLAIRPPGHSLPFKIQRFNVQR